MEPVLDHINKKMAPLVTWSNGSTYPSNLSIEIQTRNSSEKSSPHRSESNWTNNRSSVNESKNSVMFNNNHKDVDVAEHVPAEGVKFFGAQGKLLSISNNDSICSSTTTSNNVKKANVPDGGWGWMVVLASFLISMIADGASFSFGVLYIEFLNYFQESKSKTSWIGSLFMAVPLLSGPIMSALVDRYGCKYMTILGGLVSGSGFVLASLGNSVEWELIFFGVVAGLGLGLCYVTAVVSIAYWFDKYRTLAIGLGACGTGVGTFIYAPMTQFFLEEYGWRGTVLLLAGTFLNMCVCGTLMRDPDWLTSEQSKQNSLKSLKNTSSYRSVTCMDGDSQFLKKEEIRTLMKNGQFPEYILTSLATTTEYSSDPVGNDGEEPGVKSVRSVVNLPTFIKQNEKVPLEVLEQLSNKTIFKVILENYPFLLHCRSLSDDGKLNQLSTEDKPNSITMSMTLKKWKEEDIFIASPLETHSSKELAGDALLRRDIAHSLTFGPANKALPVKNHISCRDSGQHYLKNIKMHRNSVMHRGAMLNIPRYRLRASSCPNIFRNSMTTIAKENEEKWYADALELFKTMFDFSMMKELHFFLMAVATILLYTWFIVPYFYLAEHVTHHGYTEVEGSFLLSIIGVANCIGMVGLGWAGDQPWMNVTKTYAACLALCGFSCILMPLLTHNYNLLAVMSGLFGLFFASNYSFTPSILVQLMPLERFTTAYGLILLCQGIGNLVGPPLAGWIFDISGEWDLSFFMAGAWIMFSSVIVILIQFTKNRILWGSGQLEIDRFSNV